MNGTYLVGEDAPLPVVSVATDPLNLWDPDIGIYTDDNYDEEWERPAFVEFFDEEGARAFGLPTGIRIFGGFSRTYDKKSFTLRARSSYGAPDIPYRMFDDRPAERYDGFILRGYPGEHVRNPFVYEMYRAADAHVDVQAYRAVELYLNGEYWGVYQLMERKDEGFAERNHGFEHVDMLDFREVVAGDSVAYDDLLATLFSADLSDDAAFAEATRHIDLDNLIDYWIAEIHTSKRDNEKNSRYWRPRTPDGKWRWLSFDMDFMEGVAAGTLQRIAEIEDASKRPMLLGVLLHNEVFRNAFVNRYADFMNSVLRPDVTEGLIDEIAAVLRPAMPREIDRWGERPFVVSMQAWEDFLENWFKPFYAERPDHVRRHVVEQFELDGTAELVEEVAPEGGGGVHVNSLASRASGWSGTYFQGIPVSLSAEAAHGYAFAGWSGAADGTDPSVSVTLGGDTTAVALFTREDVADQDVVISEINYNAPDDADPEDWIELHHRGEAAIDVSGWIFQDEDDDHRFVIPEGTVMQPGDHLVLSEDLAAFAAFYPNVENVVGSTEFGLSGDGELVRLSNASGDLIDAVLYDDAAPWPLEPDGLGPTLELRSPDLDNALGENWAASSVDGGTPGELNSTVGTSVSDEEIRPPDVALEPNHPNPFRSSTRITFEIPQPSHARLALYDVTGREIRVLIDAPLRAGEHAIDLDGGGMASGVYIYRLRVDGSIRSRTMTLIR